MNENKPKWCLEHSSNNRAVCQQASCKQRGVKIATGELRIGTHTLFDNGVESRWYYAWRHWGCATKHQLKGLKETTDNDPTKVPGYDRVSTESQEQVRLAFENGALVEKDFKGVREDLAKSAPRYGQEYRNADGYKVDVPKRAALCRGAECLYKGTKVVHGELRLGLLIPFDGDHASWVYKHWKCMSQHDLESAKEHYEQDSLIGLDTIPAQYKQAVEETFKTGKVVDPPKIQPEVTTPKPKTPRTKRKVADEEDSEMAETPKPKKSRAKKEVEDEGEDEDAAAPKPKKSRAKKKADDEDGDEVVEAAKPKKSQAKTKVNDEDEDAEAPKPKRTRKKRAVAEVDSSEEEYVPKKTKSRQVPMEEEVDPAMAKIQSLTEQMRAEAAK